VGDDQVRDEDDRDLLTFAESGIRLREESVDDSSRLPLVQTRVTDGFSVAAEDQRNLYALDNPPERLGIARHRCATRSQVIEVIEVTSEELST
jgi:hypothetical protein